MASFCYTTELILASHFRHYTVVEHLLNNNADVEANANSLTPLAHAIEEQHITVVRLLLEKGAMVDYQYNTVSKTNLFGVKRVSLAANISVLG